MKSIVAWIALVLIVPISLIAQEGLTPGQKAFRLSLIWPSAHAEFHLGSNITLEGFASMGPIYSAANRRTSVEGNVALNYYYNANKRTANGRSTNLFSGNALSLRHSLTLWSNVKYMSRSGEERTYLRSSYVMEHVFRRPIGNIGFWEFGLGGGVAYYPSFSAVELTPSLRLGVGIGF